LTIYFGVHAAETWPAVIVKCSENICVLLNFEIYIVIITDNYITVLITYIINKC